MVFIVDRRRQSGVFQIRDLEASVEILSGGKDEALSQLRKVLKGMNSVYTSELAFGINGLHPRPYA